MRTLRLAFLTFFLAGYSAEADWPKHPLETWHVRETLPELTSLRAITYGDGKFVAVGYNVVCTSPDGSTWTRTTAGTTNTLNDIAYGGGQFVAVGNGGTIVASADGVNWLHVSSGTERNLNRISSGPEQLVAVGDRGTILTSSNAVSWTQSASGTVTRLNGVTYGKGRWLVISNERKILASRDGYTWHVQATTIYPAVLAYGAGQFVILGSGSTLRSFDGESWSEQFVGLSDRFRDMIYMKLGFVAVGTGVTSSTDGLSWIVRKSRLGEIHGIAYGNDTVVVVTWGSILQSEKITRELLERPRMVGAGEFQFTISDPVAEYRLQSSSDLSSPVWTDLGLITDQTITNVVDSPHRFFRAVPVGGP